MGVGGSQLHLLTTSTSKAGVLPGCWALSLAGGPAAGWTKPTVEECILLKTSIGQEPSATDTTGMMARVTLIEGDP